MTLSEFTISFFPFHLSTTPKKIQQKPSTIVVFFLRLIWLPLKFSKQKFKKIITTNSLICSVSFRLPNYFWCGEFFFFFCYLQNGGADCTECLVFVCVDTSFNKRLSYIFFARISHNSKTKLNLPKKEQMVFFIFQIIEKKINNNNNIDDSFELYLHCLLLFFFFWYFKIKYQMIADRISSCERWLKRKSSVCTHNFYSFFSSHSLFGCVSSQLLSSFFFFFFYFVLFFCFSSLFTACRFFIRGCMWYNVCNQTFNDAGGFVWVLQMYSIHWTLYYFISIESFRLYTFWPY